MLLLRPSPVHGIGVFTTEDIAKGAYLRLWQADDYRFLSFAEAEADPDVRQLREIYCVRDATGFHCPADFHRMSVGWFMNHSSTPNVHYSREKNYEYFALRDIMAGEEICCDYTTLTPYERAPDAAAAANAAPAHFGASPESGGVGDERASEPACAPR